MGHSCSTKNLDNMASFFLDSCLRGNDIPVVQGKPRGLGNLVRLDPDQFFLYGGDSAVQGGMDRSAEGRFAVLLGHLTDQLAFSNTVSGPNHRHTSHPHMLFQ